MSAHAWMLWPLRWELQRRPHFPTPLLMCGPGRTRMWQGRMKTAARGIYFRPFMLWMLNTPPFDEQSIDSFASQTHFPINKGQKRWLTSDLEKHPDRNKAAEWTDVEISMLGREGEKVVKLLPSLLTLKIAQLIWFLIHIFCCHLVPCLGSHGWCRFSPFLLVFNGNLWGLYVLAKSL